MPLTLQDSTWKSGLGHPNISTWYQTLWNGCSVFRIYVAILSCSKPARVADLIGYQSLIIGASQNCLEGKWTIYNRRFRLKASASRSIHWSRIDITIWNITRLSVTASHQLCLVTCSSLIFPSGHLPASSRRRLDLRICLDWNDNPQRMYPTYLSLWSSVLSLRLQPQDPKRHKASQCPARQRDRQQA